MILALGLYLFAQTFFSASSLVSQSQANSNLSSSYIASQLNSIFTSTGASMVVIGVAVLLVGPGRMLMYLQKSRHAVEYAGSSLLTVGRIFVAASVFVTAAFFTGFTTSASPSATGSSNLSYSHLSYVGWVGEVVVLLVIGAVVGFVGDMLSSGPRRVESQILRTERFQRVATYVRIADIVMLAIGIIVIVLGVLGVVGIVGGGSSSGIPGSLKLVGDGVYLLVVWAILSALAAMFHSFAYAPQPLVPRSEATGVTPQPSP